jgi:DNA-binding transcriptional MerR regulator
MRMQKRQFRIGELAQALGVERFVVRFWEKEFGLRPTRSDGGQRFYEEKDLETLQFIKELLYDKGLTIAGAKRILKESPKDARNIIASKKTTIDDVTDTKSLSPDLMNQLKDLRLHLKNLYEIL